jgi:integrase
LLGVAEWSRINKTDFLNPPPIHPGKTIRPATVNRELACMKTMLNRAARHGKLDINPISNVKKLPENNIRMRVLTLEEFERLLDACSREENKTRHLSGEI